VQQTRALYSEHAGELIQHCGTLNTYLGECRPPPDVGQVKESLLGHSPETAPVERIADKD